MYKYITFILSQYSNSKFNAKVFLLLFELELSNPSRINIF